MIISFFADGFEEIEAITPIDLLRRAGKDVKIIGVGKKLIKGANGVVIQADISEDELILDDNIEMVILPGGKNGTINLGNSQKVLDTLNYCVKNDKYVAAICAAPSVLGQNGYLNGKKATCYPGFEKNLIGAVLSDDFVVTDGKIITAKGAGVSIEFALTLVSLLSGEEQSVKLRQAIQCL